jgi:hypothetical protein
MVAVTKNKKGGMKFKKSSSLKLLGIPPKFGLNWPSGFRGEDFLLIVDGRTTDAK